MPLSRIKHTLASVARGAGADYHDQAAGHWIDDHIATPIARYREYRQSRQDFGIDVLGTLLGEPVPQNGRIKASALDKPGFGVELNPEVPLHRPYPQ